jgi:hypothetical protein
MKEARLALKAKKQHAHEVKVATQEAESRDSKSDSTSGRRAALEKAT